MGILAHTPFKIDPHLQRYIRHTAQFAEFSAQGTGTRGVQCTRHWNTRRVAESLQSAAGSTYSERATRPCSPDGLLNGLVHRDVKLSNYRFRDPSPDSPLVLLDLGFACSVDDEWDGNHCGTLMFMPPEVVGSSARVPYLPGIDVWSAGVMLFVLLTGDSPVQENEVKLFEKPETAAKAEEVIAKALDSSELKLASSEVRDLLSQLLVIDPAKRSTAAEALKHSWFGQSVTGGELPVRKKSISRMKSLSSKSSRVMAKMSTGMRKGTAGSGELPNIEVGLERIVSE